MDERLRLLRRNKTIASALLLGAVLLFVIARSCKGHGAWEWVAAFAEAALVGALADWFAVVALFRHPLGLPIPHTAIIKSRKDAIAGSLADFIRDKFLATDSLVARLRENNAAAQLATYFGSREQASALAGLCNRLLAESLDFIDDPRVAELLATAVHDRLERVDLSTTAAGLLGAVRKGNRHQIVLDDLLNRFAGWLAGEEAQERLAAAIDDLLTREYPLLSHFIPNRGQFAKGVGEKLVRRANVFIQEINADPLHEVRYRFDGLLSELGARLQSDPRLRQTVEAIKRDALQDPFLVAYAADLASDVKHWLEHDLQRTDSVVTTNIATAIEGLGRILAENRELQASLNAHLEALVVRYGDSLRMVVARHISGTVQQWNTDEYISEIELNIGSDLQFIRMNGTLVGGIIGLLLHGLALLLA